MASITSRLFSTITGMRMPRSAPFKEMGSAGFTAVQGYVRTTETNSKWVGQQRFKTADEIVTNISIVAASVHYFLNLIAHPAWTVKPKDENDKEGVELAEFVDECLKDMLTPFPRIVRRSGMYRFHGFGVQEWIAKKREDGRIGLLDIETRPAATIERWELDEDTGEIKGVWQRHPLRNDLLGIPRNKFIYLVEDTLTDSPEGLGMFRHLAEPYERLKQYLELEARAFERDLRGTPIARAPLTLIRRAVTNGDLTVEEGANIIKQMSNFVQTEVKKSNTGLVLDSMPYESQAADGLKIAGPLQYGLELLQGSSNGLGELAQAVDRIQREMARIIGTESLMMGDQGGNRALAVDKSRNLYLNANSVLGNITAAYKQDVISALWTLNSFPDDKKPDIISEDVAFKDVQEITAALRDMATAGAVMQPDDEAINDVRDLLGISKAPEPSPEMMGAFMQGLTGQKPGDEEEDAKDDKGKDDKGDQEGRAKDKSGPLNDKSTKGWSRSFEAGVRYALRKYNPDQERDGMGRWSAGGGGPYGAPGSERLIHQGKVLEEAKAWMANPQFKQSVLATVKTMAIGYAQEFAEEIAGAVTFGVMAKLVPLVAGGTMTPIAVSAFAALGVSKLVEHQVPQTVAAMILGAAAGRLVKLWRQNRAAGTHMGPIAAKFDDDPVVAGLEAFIEALEVYAQAMEKYDPDQPRDEAGRWSGGGYQTEMFNDAQMAAPVQSPSLRDKIQKFFTQHVTRQALLSTVSSLGVAMGVGILHQQMMSTYVTPLIMKMIPTAVIYGTAASFAGPVGAAVAGMAVSWAVREGVKSLGLTPQTTKAVLLRCIRGCINAAKQVRLIDPVGASRSFITAQSGMLGGHHTEHLYNKLAADDEILAGLMALENALMAQGATELVGPLSADEQDALDERLMHPPQPQRRRPGRDMSRFVETGEGLVIERNGERIS